MLAEIIMKLHQNPDLIRKMGEEGYRKVIEKYTWDKIYQETKKLYEDTINEYK